MQALHELIHSLAKEEKRLYNLHGRNSRFTQIYKGYLAVPEYNKLIDRDIYQKHFATFSKAFYSMQKNALLDDLLAVLLEYSNSSSDDFSIHRYRAKYEVLNYKGFHGQALGYIRAALESAEKFSPPRLRLRLLEDLRDTMVKSQTAEWDEYAEVLGQIEHCQRQLQEQEPLEQTLQKLDVLISSSRLQPDELPQYKSVAAEIVERLKTQALDEPTPYTQAAAFESEVRYSRTFEGKYDLHRRLVALEKLAVKAQYPKEIRLQAVNLLLESSLECGDFLLINGLIYKTQKELDNLTPILRRTFLPKYLELCAVYHFYENDTPLAQKEITDLIKLDDHPQEELLRYYFHKIGILIAANLPKIGDETIREMLEKWPKLDQDINLRIAELILTVNQNLREDALVKLQRLRSLLRKNTDSRKLSHYRLFLDMLQKFLIKKPFTIQEIPALETEWNDLLKLNLWLKAKVDNSFYYNAVLNYWHGRKKVLNY